jgi:secondary thiamine-phosphate synthase enzyme
MKTFPIHSRFRDELIDITADVMKTVSESGVQEGICIVFTPHTTAAVTINENADPDVTSDIIKGLTGIGFERMNFDHSEGNSPAHLKSSLVGCSETVIINNGRLVLGTWQGIYLCEFDGPRTRHVHVQVIGS